MHSSCKFLIKFIETPIKGYYAKKIKLFVCFVHQYSQRESKINDLVTTQRSSRAKVTTAGARMAQDCWSFAFPFRLFITILVESLLNSVLDMYGDRINGVPLFLITCE